MTLVTVVLGIVTASVLTKARSNSLPVMVENDGLVTVELVVAGSAETFASTAMPGGSASAITAPPLGAAALKPTVQVVEAGVVRLLGVQERDVTEGVTAPGASVRVADLDTPPYDAVTGRALVRTYGCPTGRQGRARGSRGDGYGCGNGKAGAVSRKGHQGAAGWAAALRVTVQVEEPGVVTVVGLHATEVRVGVTTGAARVRLTDFEVPPYDAVTVAA